MNKISITIDVSQVTKEKIIPRAFQNNQGHEVIAKDYKLDIIPLKEEKIIKEGDTWQMIKVGFVAESPTKEEKEAKTKTKIIGSAIEFRTKEARSTITPADIKTINDAKAAYGMESDEIISEDIPF